MLSVSFAILIASLLTPRVDAHGDLLPPGAIARYGDFKLRGGWEESIGFSPDKKTLIRRRFDETVLTDLATGKDVTPAYLRGLRGVLVRILHDGRHLVFAEAKDMVRVVDSATGETKLDLSEKGYRAWSARTTPDGKWVLISRNTPKNSSDVVVWNLSVTSPTSHTFPAYPYHALAPDGGRVYVWENHVLTAIDVSTGQPIGHKRKVDSSSPPRVAVSDDGKRVLVANTRSLYVVPVTANGLGEPVEYEVYHGNSEMLGHTRGGHLLLMGGEEFDLDTGKRAKRPVDFDRPGHYTQWPSADGTLVAELQSNHSVIVWDVTTCKTIRRFDGSPEAKAAVLGDDGKTVLVADELLALRRYDLSTGKLLGVWAKRKTGVQGHERWPVPFDGGVVEVDDATGCAVVFDAATGIDRATLDHGIVKEKRTGELPFVDVRSDLDRAVITLKGQTAVVELSTGKRLHTLSTSSQAAALSPDGRLLASVHDYHVLLTEVRTGKVRRTLSTNRLLVDRMSIHLSFLDTWGKGKGSRVRFTPDGSRVAAFGREAGGVWTIDGDLLADFESDEKTFGALGPDGRWLAMHHDGRFVLIDLNEPSKTKRHICPPAFPLGLRSVEFTTDGHLLTAHADGLAYLWDVQALVVLHRQRSPLPTDDTLWAMLADADGLKAGAAVDALVADPVVAVRVLGASLTPVVADAKFVARLIDQLRDRDFKVRDAAEKELARLGEIAASPLRTTLEVSDSPEQTERVGRLLKRLDGPVVDPETMRRLRAVEVLERVGTGEAREVLAKVAGGASTSVVTTEAEAALKRLAKRKK